MVVFLCAVCLGQGRFCTIIRSYSRGAQGVILVYDITNKWSFDGIDRWLKEVEEVCYNHIKFPPEYRNQSILSIHSNLKIPSNTPLLNIKFNF